MTTALIVYDQEDGITFFVTENLERIASAKKFNGKYVNEAEQSEADDDELMTFIELLTEDECSVELPHTGDMINEVYHIGFLG
jgi:hypothetical protein